MNNFILQIPLVNFNLKVTILINNNNNGDKVTIT